MQLAYKAHSHLHNGTTFKVFHTHNKTPSCSAVLFLRVYYVVENIATTLKRATPFVLKQLALKTTYTLCFYYFYLGFLGVC